MPGVKRKPILFTYKHIKDGLLSISNKMDRFMLAVSYANGTRVSEVLGIRAADIEWNDEFVYVTTPVKKKRYYVEPHRAPPISRRGEAWLADLIIGYVEENRDKDRLIDYSKRTAQRRFEEYFECTAHSFRHTRATHCLAVLKLSMREVADYFKLSSKGLSDWMMRYGHLAREDMESSLRERFA